MSGLSTVARHGIVAAEHGVLRLFVVALGVAFMMAGLALGISVVLLPVGLILSLAGVGLVMWGLRGDLFANASHTPWNCRWSRLNYQVAGGPAQGRSDSPWVCVHSPGVRRAVTNEECARCELWERTDERES